MVALNKESAEKGQKNAFCKKCRLAQRNKLWAQDYLSMHPINAFAYPLFRKDCVEITFKQKRDSINIYYELSTFKDEFLDAIVNIRETRDRGRYWEKR